MSVRVHLGIPFYGDQPDRLRNYTVVTAALHNMLADRYVIKVLGNPPSIKDRGAARNAIVRAAEGWNADIVVIADADCIPEEDALHSAVNAAYTRGGLHFAYDRYRELNKKGTKHWLLGQRERAVENLHMECYGSVGGLLVVRPRDWAYAGWSPELSGWGFEDVIFGEQARTFLGDNTWHSGWLTHLYHPSEVRIGSDQYNHNIAICKTFEDAGGDPNKMRDLIKSGLGNHPGWTSWDDLNRTQ